MTVMRVGEKIEVIAIYPVVPMRKEPSERGEMVSQLLLGESMEILEEQPGWAHIKSSIDSYMGWVDRKMIAEVLLKSATEKYLVNTPVAWIQEEGSESPVLVSAGSSFPEYDKFTDHYNIGPRKFRLLSGSISRPCFTTIVSLLEHARNLLNTSYLWGGRTAFGIDCSGFTQMVFRLSGITLPRDAKDQALAGRCLSVSEGRKPGDLAFFKNELGKIAHVGLLIDEYQIIHASGNVHIDSIDSIGIYNMTPRNYTHNLAFCIRIIEDSGEKSN